MGNFKKIAAIFILSAVLAAAAIFIVNKFKKSNVALVSQISERNGITFEASPMSSNEFKITITTHSGSLDFDMRQVSQLRGKEGNIYQPLSWEGSGPGGHHRSGTLIFPKPEARSKSLELLIQDDPNLEPRVFNWNLK